MVFLCGSNGIVPCNVFNRLCGVVWWRESGGSGEWCKAWSMVLVIVVVMTGGGGVDGMVWLVILVNIILIIILCGVGCGVGLGCGYAQVIRALP